MKACAVVLLAAGSLGFAVALPNIGKAPQGLLGITVFALSWFLVPTVLMVAGIELWNRAWKKAKDSKQANPRRSGLDLHCRAFRKP